ncbi:MAG: hypothetical protein ACR2OG_00380 [Gemmatimonadaceae bacterium]
MTSPTMVQLCGKIARDSDEHVRSIGQRCLRDYDEFSGLKYARLTAGDEQLILSAALSAHASKDASRGDLLDELSLLIRATRAG